ncbi:hypothetical protein CYY_001747 [Polysphondylium violaceum]|uniref:TraB family protein n=1 Tax=Polysphondylium violaceum TaxID=133409 RepID=A0A8J4PZN5_9MYCE|nr:hypothetical protein CYY_001747 [Polysphondylium violaceum]
MSNQSNNNNNNEPLDFNQIEKLIKIRNHIKNDPQKFLNVVKNENTGSTVYLVGCNHVSPESMKNVTEILDIVKPDTVFLELSLDKRVLLTATNQQLARELTKRPTIRWINSSLNDFFLSVMNSLYWHASKMPPQQQLYFSGTEMRVAYDYAIKNQCKLVLGDRDTKTTLQRVSNKFTWSNILQYSILGLGMVYYLATSEPETIRSDYHKQIKELDEIAYNDEKLLNSIQIPCVKKVYVDERDRYMASSIRDSPGKSIVAVVGKAHVYGIGKYINEPYEGFYLRADLENYTEPTFISKYSYPIVLGTALGTPAALSVISTKLVFRKAPKPLLFGIGCGVFVGQAIGIDYLIKRVQDKLEKVEINN